MSPSRRLQPVYRGVHWRLECRCGALLAECVCPAPVKHLEVWQDGCAFRARWSTTPPSPPGRPPTGEEAPPRPQRGKLAAHAATICADVLAGGRIVDLAHRYAVTPAAISHVLRKHGVPKYALRRKSA